MFIMISYYSLASWLYTSLPNHEPIDILYTFVCLGFAWLPLQSWNIQWMISMCISEVDDDIYASGLVGLFLGPGQNRTNVKHRRWTSSFHISLSWNEANLFNMFSRCQCAMTAKLAWEYIWTKIKVNRSFINHTVVQYSHIKNHINKLPGQFKYRSQICDIPARNKLRTTTLNRCTNNWVMNSD
jgi:hypothetical protein